MVDDNHQTKRGGTINSWANALIWSTEALDKKTIALKNTHEANPLDIQVLVSTVAGELEVPLPGGAASLDAGDSALIALNDAYAQVRVQVKSTNTDAPASYQLDYIGFASISAQLLEMLPSIFAKILATLPTAAAKPVETVPWPKP